MALQIDEDTFEVDGASFRIDYIGGSTGDLLCIRKPPELIRAYAALIDECAPSRIVELGIAGGGSTALLALLAAPSKLVALELDPDPVPGLADFLNARGLTDTVRPYYGIDQADREAVTQILEHELDGPLDLVIDDASHFFAESRASFEMLFPLVRPGGLYVIEDWATHDRYAAWAAKAAATDAEDPSPRPRPALERAGEFLQLGQPGRDTPLSRLVAELVLARAGLGEAVEQLTIDRHWVVVRRGQTLDSEPFRLSEHYADPFGILG